MTSIHSALLGPLLGYESGDLYTVCVLTRGALIDTLQLQLSSGPVIAFARAGDTPSGRYWRAECQIARTALRQEITYQISSASIPLAGVDGQTSWTFGVPSTTEQARLAYACCNGFSSQDLAASTSDPYAMWEKLLAEHEAKPFSLLLMGGDQLYADSVLTLSGVKEWTEKTDKEMKRYKPSQQLIARLDQFYDDLYQERWSNKAMAQAFATIPCVMMWDDHDIVDGWGSHEDIPQSTEMYREIYRAARKYFKLYQLRTLANRSLLDRAQADEGHFAMGLDFCDFRILAMDHRSNRTLNDVMSEAQHQAVKVWIAAASAPQNPPSPARPLLAMSGIPMVYRSFAALESVMGFTPWTEEATDDVRDHWMASHHRGERIRLIKNLLDYKDPVWLLSGDVHVGGLGVISDTASGKKIYQVISTGIVHPPPSAIEWAGLCFLTNDNPEQIAGTTISTEMLTPSNSGRYIRDRNFAILQRDEKGKVWVNWICESKSKTKPPEFVA